MGIGPVFTQRQFLAWTGYQDVMGADFPQVDSLLRLRGICQNILDRGAGAWKRMLEKRSK